jgi:hypothetical protein
MREEVLKEFFVGNVDVKVLAKDLRGAMVTSGGITKHPIEDMTDTFELRPEHLTRLCDAVLVGDLKPEHLQAIGFCIVASDHFEYDTDSPEGDLVGDTAMEWSAPIVHYPLTLANVAKFRERLITGKDPFTLADAI